MACRGRGQLLAERLMIWVGVTGLWAIFFLSLQSITILKCNSYKLVMKCLDSLCVCRILTFTLVYISSASFPPAVFQCSAPSSVPPTPAPSLTSGSTRPSVLRAFPVLLLIL